MASVPRSFIPIAVRQDMRLPLLLTGRYSPGDLVDDGLHIGTRAWYSVRWARPMPLNTAPLERAGLRITEEDLEATFSEALAAVLPPYPTLDAREALPADELAFLQQAGVTLDELAPLPADVVPPEVRTAGKLASILASALPVPDAAERLGVDASTLRHRIAARSVYAIRVNGAWRLPLFQFTDALDAIVPGFGELALALGDLHPVDVFNWFTLPHVDLEIAERRVSPREWLLSRGSPQRLIALLDEIRGVA